MNVYELEAENQQKWVWFFTRDKLALPFDAKDEAAFFDAHPVIPVIRNTESARSQGVARFSDFSNLNYNTYPVFSDRAKQLLSTQLDGLGRWVKLENEGAPPYWLFWVLNVADALDEEASEIQRFSSGRIMRIASFAFKPGSLEGQWLFRTPQRLNSHHFVTQTFVDFVKDHRLTGFTFRRLWSSSIGPVPSTLKDWEKPRITGLEDC